MQKKIVLLGMSKFCCYHMVNIAAGEKRKQISVRLNERTNKNSAPDEAAFLFGILYVGKLLSDAFKGCGAF